MSFPHPLPAVDVPLPSLKTIYPAPFAALVAGRVKRKLGDFFGLTNFGVNLTQLAPGAISALLHAHTVQDEFIYVLDGTPTLVLGDEELLLQPGDCFGFKGGAGVPHQLINRTQSRATYLEVGDRSAGDDVDYPRDDLKFHKRADGSSVLVHKDGRPY